MNTGIVRTGAVLMALAVLGGCATAGVDRQSNPILSAEQTQAMIHVEVRVLEPLPIEQALADLQ